MILAQHLDYLAIFPLPGTVLFPGSVIPLHIFEPRYRDMVRDALDKGMPIAIAMIEEGTAGLAKPPVKSVVGVGTIVQHDSLPNGRSNILLQGVARVRIVEELVTDTPYRVVRAQEIPDIEGDSRIVDERVETLRHCFLSLHTVHPQLAAALTSVLVNVEEPGPFSNILASVLFSEAEDRQEILEEPDVAKRLDRVLTQVSELLARAPNPDANVN